LIAGFFRPLDAPVMRVVDAMMSFPDILLAIALVGILGPSMLNVVLALVLVYTPAWRAWCAHRRWWCASCCSWRRRAPSGISTLRILWRHILPNLMSPILCRRRSSSRYAILAEAALSFLGVGVPPEIPTWGTMVAGSQQYAHQALWIVLFPGLAIIVTALSLQLAGRRHPRPARSAPAQDRYEPPRRAQSQHILRDRGRSHPRSRRRELFRRQADARRHWLANRAPASL
jgi:peptide/nickel transport system permease protein